MAVAWIAYLDLDEVREWSAPFREACFDWRWQRWRIGFDGPIHEGWHLEQRSKPTLNLLAISGAYDRANERRPLVMSIKEARETLWIALREGFFVATGIPTDSDRRVLIPALEWHELVAVEGRGEVNEVRHGLIGAGYKEVLVPSVAVRGLWRKQIKVVQQLPPTMRPDGNGYMPLTCAAQWIATEGGRHDFDAADRAIWKHAFDKLLGAIASEKVRVVGVRNGGRESVSGLNFASIEVDYPFTEAPLDLVTGNVVYLQCYPYLGEEEWRRIVHDSLVRDRIHIWTHLQVERGDIRALWPFGSDRPTVSGAPGRPTSMHLVMTELERRAAAGEMSKSIVEECRYLSRWLAERHADSPQAKPKSIEASIRSRYYELRGRK